MVFKWMNAFNLAIATVVDLVLTGAFVTIMRQKRTGFSRYVYSSTPVPQRYRSRTETQTTEQRMHHRTDAVLNRLSRYAVFASECSPPPILDHVLTVARDEAGLVRCVALYSEPPAALQIK